MSFIVLPFFIQKKKKFIQVCEEIYRKGKKYHKVVGCYIKDEERKNNVFECIKDILKIPNLPEDSKSRLRKVVVTSIPELIHIDGTETANLVLEHFAEEHENILKQLEAFPNLQYQVISFSFSF